MRHTSRTMRCAWSRLKKEAKRCSSRVASPLGPAAAQTTTIAWLIRWCAASRISTTSTSGSATRVTTPKTFESKHTCSGVTYIRPWSSQIPTCFAHEKSSIGISVCGSANRLCSVAACWRSAAISAAIAVSTPAGRSSICAGVGGSRHDASE